MDWKRIAASVLMLGVLAVPASAASITPQTTMKEIRDDPDIKASGLYTYTYVWERDCERLSTSRDASHAPPCGRMRCPRSSVQ